MELKYRYASIREAELYFAWANDKLVRQNSYENGKISFEQHLNWFNSKLLNKHCYLYVFFVDELAAGQVRIEIGIKETVIGISLDDKFRGKSLSSEMILKASLDFLNQNQNQVITAYIKLENVSSYKSFLKAGFTVIEEVLVRDFKSYKLIKKYDE
jgi:RimJ/RimL family protein N-acetyltransferase